MESTSLENSAVTYPVQSRNEISSPGLKFTLQKMIDIENILNSKDVKFITNEELLHYSNELKTLRNKLESLGNLNVLHSENFKDQLINESNDDLKRKLEEENIFNMTLKEIIDNVIVTWDVIVTEMINPKLYDFDDKKDTYENIYTIAINILNILLRKEKIIFVGIGFIILSFFVFFIFVTK